MRSQETCWKRQDAVDGMGMRGGGVGWVFALFCWQVAHPLTYLQMKVASLGHQNSVVTSCLIFNTPG